MNSSARKQKKGNYLYIGYTDSPTGIANLSSIRTHVILEKCAFWLFCGRMLPTSDSNNNISDIYNNMKFQKILLIIMFVI